MKKILLVFTLICVQFQSFAQEETPVEPLVE
ncbi:hypothetical protein DSL99_1544 [Leeuwenhoekiella marinoflava]|uniref:Uncharacterized protein n=1 Tax=Leeuwenhoekiella marinoflava TaxID=988 RepID=A0A4Q0PMH8_9FLAO|nr:hypothetical protein DSL99_1544 [Leeuwenhoekiella marinoflava]